MIVNVPKKEIYMGFMWITALTIVYVATLSNPDANTSAYVLLSAFILNFVCSVLGQATAGQYFPYSLGQLIMLAYSLWMQSVYGNIFAVWLVIVLVSVSIIMQAIMTYFQVIYWRERGMPLKWHQML